MQALVEHGTGPYVEDRWRPVLCACLAVLAGCASLIPLNTNLEIARSELKLATASEDILFLAGPDLGDASDAMDEAQSAWLRHASQSRVDGLALVVTQRVAKARHTAAERLLELRRIDREPEKFK